jgi:hypothetical protein
MRGLGLAAKTKPVDELVFLFVQLTSFVILDREDVPSARVRLRTPRCFNQRPMLVHAAAMLPTVAPSSFIMGVRICRGCRRAWALMQPPGGRSSIPLEQRG